MIQCNKCMLRREGGRCLRCWWTPKRIYQARSRLHLTQDMFAHALGVAWVTVARWESTIGSRPSKRNLSLLEEKIKAWEEGGFGPTSER